MLGVSRKRAGRRLASVAAAVALVAAVPAMAAASVTWTAQTVPPRSSGQPVGKMSGVSCGSVTLCVAIPTDGEYNSPALVPGVEIWNGSAWSGQVLPAPSGYTDGAVHSVSCVSATSCVAIGALFVDDGVAPMLAEVWNGSTWTAQIIPEPKAGDGALTGISCDSPTNCTAIGYYDSSATSPAEPLAERWNGTKWTAQFPVPATGVNSELEAVSCPTSSSCTAIGFVTGSGEPAPLIETWKPGSWQVEYDSLPAGTAYLTLESVSCTTAAICFAAGTDGTATLRDNPVVMQLVKGSWTGPVSLLPKVAASGGLGGISCTVPGTTTVCTVAGGYTTSTVRQEDHALAEYWNGHTWANQPIAPTTPPTGKTLEAVSCAAGTSDCEAVGYQDAGNMFAALAEGN